MLNYDTRTVCRLLEEYIELNRDFMEKQITLDNNNNNRHSLDYDDY